MDNKNKGFTLFEVLVAITIIAIGFLAVFRLHSRTISLHGDIRFYTTASLLSQQKIAEITGSSETFVDSSGRFEDDFDGYAWKATVSDIETELEEEVGTDLKKVELTITLEKTALSYNTSVIRYVKGD
jgi:prepilin-type N-terminal cleavage/methylation domain-containing protein